MEIHATAMTGGYNHQEFARVGFYFYYKYFNIFNTFKKFNLRKYKFVIIQILSQIIYIS